MRRWAVLLLCVGAAGCVSKSKYESAMARLKTCQEESEACARDRDAATTERDALKKQLAETQASYQTSYAEAVAARDAAEKRVAEMEASLSTTKSELEQLRKQRAEAERRLAAYREINAKFKKMIDSGRISVHMRGGRMIVQLPAGVLFASGKADLSREGKQALAEVAAILREFPDRRFVVAGHTDAVPLRGSKYADNWELSTARALTVTKFLVGEGVKPENLSAAGYGEHDPIAGNDTEEGRQQNRRIELILVPNLSELPQDEPLEEPASQPSP